jgi:hypothetical protein
MKIIAKQWLQLREAPGQEPARHSFIRLKNIDSISIVETEPENEYRFSVLVVVGETEYLYSTALNEAEGDRHVTYLIESIERAK